VRVLQRRILSVAGLSVGMAVDGGLTASSPVSAKAGSGGGSRACGGCDCVYLWKRIWLLLKNTAQMLLKNRWFRFNQTPFN
jgi:hypothetical protein